MRTEACSVLLKILVKILVRIFWRFAPGLGSPSSTVHHESSSARILKSKDILESQGHTLEKSQRSHRTNRLSKGRIFQSKSEVAILTWPVKFGSYFLPNLLVLGIPTSQNLRKILELKASIPSRNSYSSCTEVQKRGLCRIPTTN